MNIGTRGSKLALIQASMVSDALIHSGTLCTITEISSHGDVDRNSPIYSLGRVGVFVESLNRKILDGEIDCAVHSAKDIPTTLEDGLEISAVLRRGSFTDSLVSGVPLSEMKPGSVIGTSSLRRIKALKSMREDLQIKDIRGNIDTRIEKAGSGDYDGLITATAALNRIGFRGKFFEIDPLAMVPAANQGIIAVVSGEGSEASRLLSAISHDGTMNEMRVERQIASGLQLGCSEPAGIIAEAKDRKMSVYCRFYNKNGFGFMDFSSDDITAGNIDDFIEGIRHGIPMEYGYRK